MLICSHYIINYKVQKDVEFAIMRKVVDDVGMNTYYWVTALVIINLNAKKFVERKIILT